MVGLDHVHPYAEGRVLEAQQGFSATYVFVAEEHAPENYNTTEPHRQAYTVAHEQGFVSPYPKITIALFEPMLAVHLSGRSVLLVISNSLSIKIPMATQLVSTPVLNLRLQGSERQPNHSCPGIPVPPPRGRPAPARYSITNCITVRLARLCPIMLELIIFVSVGCEGTPTVGIMPVARS